MAYKDTLPTTNLTVDDIRDTLGESTTNVGRLCTSANINMFAKYKPVVFPAFFPHFATHPSGAANAEYDPTWWQGRFGDCGITIPDLSTISEVGVKNWTYSPPTGGDSSPYRLLDFGGYVHKARPVVCSGVTEHVTVNKLDQTVYAFGFPMVSPSLTGNLSLNDIASIRNYYFAVAITDADNRQVIITADTPLKDGGSNLTVDFGALSAFKRGVKLNFMLYSQKHLQSDILQPTGTMKAIYHDSKYINPANVTIENRQLIGGTFTEVASYLGGWYNPVGNYSGLAGAQFPTNGDASFKMTLTNSASRRVSISTSDLVMNVMGYLGYAAGIGVSGMIYNSSKVQVNAITLEANATGTFYLSGPIFNWRSDGTLGNVINGSTTASCMLMQRTSDGLTYFLAGVNGLKITT